MNWHKVKKPCSPRIEPSGELIRLPCAPRQLIHFHCKTTAVQRMNDFWVSSTTTATRHVQQNERLHHMNEWLCWPSDLRRWFSWQAPPVHMVCVCAAPLRRLYITAGKPTSASVNTILINNDDVRPGFLLKDAYRYRLWKLAFEPRTIGLWEPPTLLCYIPLHSVWSAFTPRSKVMVIVLRIHHAWWYFHLHSKLLRGDTVDCIWHQVHAVQLM